MQTYIIIFRANIYIPLSKCDINQSIILTFGICNDLNSVNTDYSWGTIMTHRECIPGICCMIPGSKSKYLFLHCRLLINHTSFYVRNVSSLTDRFFLHLCNLHVQTEISPMITQLNCINELVNIGGISIN